MVLQVISNCLPSGLKSQLSHMGPVAFQSLFCCVLWGSSPRCLFNKSFCSKGQAQRASEPGARLQSGFEAQLLLQGSRPSWSVSLGLKYIQGSSPSCSQQAKLPQVSYFAADQYVSTSQARGLMPAASLGY
jgi:hypothetical protein